MATVRIPDQGVTIDDRDEVAERLRSVGVEYDAWPVVEDNASDEEALAFYRPYLESLMSRGGYSTIDLIDVKPATAGLDAMLARFRREHWHDEDEVRIILRGRGVFHIHPSQGSITVIEVEPGDLIRVPRGTLHWFDLCSDRTIRAIRLFQDKTGWTPHYSESGAEENYQPVCLGQHEILPSSARLK